MQKLLCSVLKGDYDSTSQRNQSCLFDSLDSEGEGDRQVGSDTSEPYLQRETERERARETESANILATFGLFSALSAPIFACK